MVYKVLRQDAKLNKILRIVEGDHCQKIDEGMKIFSEKAKLVQANTDSIFENIHKKLDLLVGEKLTAELAVYVKELKEKFERLKELFDIWHKKMALIHTAHDYDTKRSSADILIKEMNDHLENVESITKKIKICSERIADPEIQVDKINSLIDNEIQNLKGSFNLGLETINKNFTQVGEIAGSERWMLSDLIEHLNAHTTNALNQIANLIALIQEYETLDIPPEFQVTFDRIKNSYNNIINDMNKIPPMIKEAEVAKDYMVKRRIYTNAIKSLKDEMKKLEDTKIFVTKTNDDLQGYKGQNCKKFMDRILKLTESIEKFNSEQLVTLNDGMLDFKNRKERLNYTLGDIENKALETFKSAVVKIEETRVKLDAIRKDFEMELTSVQRYKIKEIRDNFDLIIKGCKENISNFKSLQKYGYDEKIGRLEMMVEMFKLDVETTDFLRTQIRDLCISMRDVKDKTKDWKNVYEVLTSCTSNIEEIVDKTSKSLQEEIIKVTNDNISKNNKQLSDHSRTLINSMNTSLDQIEKRKKDILKEGKILNALDDKDTKNWENLVNETTDTVRDLRKDIAILSQELENLFNQNWKIFSTHQNQLKSDKELNKQLEDILAKLGKYLTKFTKVCDDLNIISLKIKKNDLRSEAKLMVDELRNTVEEKLNAELNYLHQNLESYAKTYSTGGKAEQLLDKYKNIIQSNSPVKDQEQNKSRAPIEKKKFQKTRRRRKIRRSR